LSLETSPTDTAGIMEKKLPFLDQLELDGERPEVDRTLAGGLAGIHITLVYAQFDAAVERDVAD
jgi:hypothetical protein